MKLVKENYNKCVPLITLKFLTINTYIKYLILLFIILYRVKQNKIKRFKHKLFVESIELF